MKPTDDGLGKLVRTVMIAVGVFLAIVALTLTCSRPAKADHKGEPKVQQVMTPSGVMVIDIDATDSRASECGMWTDDPDLASLFYQFVTDQIMPGEWMTGATKNLMDQGWTFDDAAEFARQGVLRCTVGKDS